MKSLAAPGFAALLLVCTACTENAVAPGNVVARVNGVDITAGDLDAQFARAIAGAEGGPGEEQTLNLKLQLLTDMIGNQILLQLAAEAELTATDAEVDVRFNEFRSQYTEERFSELLSQQKATVEDVRRDMRESLTIEKLINKEITSRISVSQAEIEEFYNANVERFDLPESFRVSHILVTPTVDLTITNSTGDDASTSEEAAEKAQRLFRVIQGGEDFATVARQYSEDPTTATVGGDLGFQPMQALRGVDPAFGDAVAQIRVGETFPRVVATEFGYHVLKLVDRDPGGQKDLTDARIEAQIRQTIFDQRDQTLRAAFFETVRNQAEIRNYFAERILDAAGS